MYITETFKAFLFELLPELGILWGTLIATIFVLTCLFYGHAVADGAPKNADYMDLLLTGARLAIKVWTFFLVAAVIFKWFAGL
ncbi:MAG: hypothetical protein GKR94_30265 [Gammaproteobacteria bacterium]|nr:hypothetical protein [Gammaproteobacteria bacterium]